MKRICQTLFRTLVCAVVLASSAGCFMTAPTYREPYDEDMATLQPGFDSSVGQLAHWHCAAGFKETPKGETIAVGAVDIVLLKHPKRGLLLHDVNNDWIMVPQETIAGGGTIFKVSVPGEVNEFIVPSDHTLELTHHFARIWIGLGTDAQTLATTTRTTTEKVTQMCGTAGPVRFL